MTEVTSYRQLESNNELLEEVIQQVNKDFGSHAIDFAWHTDDVDAYSRFVSDVQKHVTTLLDRRKTKIMELVYRVDVFESKMRVVWTLDEEDRAGKITELILNRELQKVLTRRLYKRNDNT